MPPLCKHRPKLEIHRYRLRHPFLLFWMQKYTHIRHEEILQIEKNYTVYQSSIVKEYSFNRGTYDSYVEGQWTVKDPPNLTLKFKTKHDSILLSCFLDEVDVF